MPPVDDSPSGNIYGHFELIYSLKINDAIPVNMYKSVNTGITVYIVETDGPVVSGYFNLATEAFDDDGLPHTLEHLIFLGSEEYPYKGILDLWANRCLASGTNAGTDFDHTYYTMVTAGSEGFLFLMPIYLEHILYPTLKDSAYLTEVHHITDKGQDAGVVYCEMQGRENTGECMTFKELLKAIYPGECGYKSNTGGALWNLRKSTDIKKVREYHKQFYRPENLTLVIIGQVNHTDVFRVLQPLELKIMLKGKRDLFKRPWQTEAAPFTEHVELDVHYPCDDEDNGIVYVSWRGPSVNEVYDCLGCSLLLKYLTDTPVSPLQKQFVETNDPFASNVTYIIYEFSSSVLCLVFENVLKNKINLIKKPLTLLLGDICNAQNGIDMKRMNMIVHKNILESLSALEIDPHDTIAFMLFRHVIYGNTKEDLDQRLNNIRDLKKLESEPESYWINLLRKYFVSSTMVVAKGMPSIEKQRILMQEEEKRIAKQIEKLGEDGLKEKKVALLHAIKENEKPIPKQLLASIPIPGIDTISFHNIKSYNTNTEQHPKLNANKLPMFTYLDHVNTNFIYLSVVINTTDADIECKKYIPLFLEVIKESPVERSGQLISHEEIIAELETDTIVTTTGIGINNSMRFSCGAYNECVNLTLQLELDKYNKGIQWIKELLYNTVLNVDRLKIVATKMINDVARLKRKGHKITNDLMKGLIYSEKSNYFLSNMLRQQKFLLDTINKLNNDVEQKEVLAKMEILRETLTSLPNMILHMALDIEKLTAQVPNVYAPWNTFFPEKDNLRFFIADDWMFKKPLESISTNGCIMGLGCTESSFLCQTSPCMYDYQHCNLPALLVALQYFNQVEGPMWKSIRGQGLSYGYNIFPMPHEGLLYLNLYRSTNIIAAYKETKSIVKAHFSQKAWDKLLYESAKSSMIYEIIHREKTLHDAVTETLLSHFKHVPLNFNHTLVRRISVVTMEEMINVAAMYLMPLFQPAVCKTTIVCHPSKVVEIGAAFKEMNHELELYKNLEDTYLNEW